jgi:hypothetical protein
MRRLEDITSDIRAHHQIIQESEEHLRLLTAEHAFAYFTGRMGFTIEAGIDLEFFNENRKWKRAKVSEYQAEEMWLTVTVYKEDGTLSHSNRNVQDPARLRKLEAPVAEAATLETLDDGS